VSAPGGIGLTPPRILAILLIVGGVLGLAYGSFTWVTDSHDLDLGVMEVSMKERETVNIPVWAGVAGIASGLVLMFFRKPSWPPSRLAPPPPRRSGSSGGL
jgi:hypothetical protein